MQLFLNELSLHGQYGDEQSFVNAIREITAMFGLLLETSERKELFTHSILFSGRNVGFVENLHIALNRLKDKSLKRRFYLLVHDKLNLQYWEGAPVKLEADIYRCLNTFQDVSANSLAEIAARVEQQPNADEIYFVLNFINSCYDSNKLDRDADNVARISLRKNEEEVENENENENEVQDDTNEEIITLDCSDNRDQLASFLLLKQLIDTVYDASLSRAPLDSETVLRDSSRFTKTADRCKGRRIYHEIATNRLWYVDSFHYGKASHLEVFDSQGNHLGEASLDGILDEAKKDTDKKIR